MIEEYDAPVLEFLKDIRIESFSEPSTGYSLQFFFASNPYFKNEVYAER